MAEQSKVTSSVLYARAEKRLREAHEDEFRKILVEEYAAEKVVYKPRLSKEERAVVERERRLARARASVAAMVTEYGSEVLPTTPVIKIADGTETF